MHLWAVHHSLCLSKQPLLVRAINLYAFQAAIFHPLGSDQSRRARLAAAYRIFEEANANNQRIRKLHERLGRAGYAELEQILLKADPRRIRSLGTLGDFAKKVDEGLSLSKDVAGLVHVSHRIATFGPHDPNKTGGTTMARPFLVATVTDSPSDGTYLNRLAMFKDREVLSYLIHYHFSDLQPARLSSRKFVPSLLNQTRDTKTLSAFFAGYVDLAKALHNQYHFERLRRPSHVPRTNFALTDFSKKEREFLENYKSKPKKTKKKPV